MRLNTLKPAEGSKHSAKRLGRGIGSGIGKTCGHGHKGQKSRSGGGVKPGFEGGQMPLQRRLPKFGFTSRKSQFRDEVRLNDLNKLDAGTVTLDVLKENGLVSAHINDVKVILSGKLDKAFKIEGLKVTAGAKKAIEAAGGAVA